MYRTPSAFAAARPPLAIASSLGLSIGSAGTNATVYFLLAAPLGPLVTSAAPETATASITTVTPIAFRNIEPFLAGISGKYGSAERDVQPSPRRTKAVLAGTRDETSTSE